MKLVDNKLYKTTHKLLILCFCAFILSCNSGEEEVLVPEDDNFITKQSSLALLMKSAVADNPTNSCVIYKYPMNFLIKKPSDDRYNLIRVISNSDLHSVFNDLTTQDKIRIDFPISLMDVDFNETVISSFEELEGTLEIAVDACNGSTEYEYCDSNNKKVYVCHNGNNICISVNALRTHLDHGDELGQCSGS